MLGFKGKYVSQRSYHMVVIGFWYRKYPNESKGFNLLDIKTKYIIIERSVKFDEPLQEVEVVKEKTVEFPSYSTEYLDDEIWDHDPDLDPMIYDISVY